MSYFPRLSVAAGLLALGLASALGGCSVDDGAGTLRTILGTGASGKSCPRALVVSDARNYYELAAGGRTSDDLRLTGRIGLPTAGCEVDEGRLRVTLSLPIEVVRGPRLKDGSFEVRLPYFVAVTDLSGRILDKQVFTASISMGGDQKLASKVERIEQVIPLKSGEDATRFVIYAGFQLTAEQLEFNRRNRL